MQLNLVMLYVGLDNENENNVVTKEFIHRRISNKEMTSEDVEDL